MTDFARIARKITLTLFAAQALASAGFIVTAPANVIAGAQLSGQAAWATVPTFVYLVGQALASLAWGYGMDRLGRRGGLALGLLLGATGSALAAGAIIGQSFVVFIGGLALIGAANAATQLSRFAAAEVHPPGERGRAISNVVIAGTIGAVFGPLLGGPVGRTAQALGLAELSGPYGASLILFALAAGVILWRLRPDPRDVGRELAQIQTAATGHQGTSRSIPLLLRQPAVIVAMAAMIFGQLTMVMLMVITSLHMSDHDHALDAIYLVTSSHTFGMFAFSVFSGRLADRWGRGPVILVGAATLILACLVAPLSPDVLPIAVALFLLGLGWNFCYVGGSSLLADQLSPAERARTQGFNDLLIALVSAAGSLGSGRVFATAGYGAMALVGIAAACIPLALTLWWQMGRRAAVAARGSEL
jgi:MFS family permease